MGLNANDQPSSGGGEHVEQDPMAIGLYPARIVQIIDLGLQPQKAWQGKPKDAIRQLNLTYEFSEEFMKDEDGNDVTDRPRWLSETVPFHNLKADKAKSTLRYRAIDPDSTVGGEFTEIGGMPCQVAIVHNEKNGKTYNNVGDVSGAVNLKGYKQPELVNPVKVFITDEPDMDVWKELPEWLQNKIKDNLEYNGSVLQAKLGEEAKPEPAQDDVPAGNAAPPAPPAPPAPDVPQ